LTAATTVALLAGVGVATGAIPDEDGQIQGCYGKRNGRLRVVDRASECRRKETPLAWDQHAAATSNAVTRIGSPTPITGYPAGSVSITTATAACHRGERAVGGGYTIDADPPASAFNMGTLESQPTAVGQHASEGRPADGWRVRIANPSSHEDPSRNFGILTVTVLCAA
jgi:hypothetical protein